MGRMVACAFLYCAVPGRLLIFGSANIIAANDFKCFAGEKLPNKQHDADSAKQRQE